MQPLGDFDPKATHDAGRPDQHGHRMSITQPITGIVVRILAVVTVTALLGAAASGSSTSRAAEDRLGTHFFGRPRDARGIETA